MASSNLSIAYVGSVVNASLVSNFLTQKEIENVIYDQFHNRVNVELMNSFSGTNTKLRVMVSTEDLNYAMDSLKELFSGKK
ncbi:MAG: hypothetical protein N4A45_08345 [Flavobacteriales bacterium]|jgi:hypothetical protein|nr:hypothetical protein [Flavobacteriales bacterium]